MAHPVNWFHVSAKDVKAQTKFYKSLFAWKTKAGPGGMTFVAKDEGGIDGGIAPMQQSTGISIYVGVEKLEKYIAKAEKGGGKLGMPPMDLPPGMGRIAGIIDPEGNFVGLWEAGKAPPPAKKSAKKPAKKAAKKGAKKAKG